LTAQVTSGIDRAHPAEAKHFVDLVAVDQDGAALEDGAVTALRALGGYHGAGAVLEAIDDAGAVLEAIDHG